jgi:hypothetical protein
MASDRERSGPSAEATAADPHGEDDELAARVARECALQGIPAKFDDVEIIDNVIALIVSPNGDGPSRGPRSRRG